MESQVKRNEWHVVSAEKYRTYRFPDGSQYTITDPWKLKVTTKINPITKLPQDSHRILTKDNVAHYVPVGWIGLFWESHNENPFLF